MKDTFEYLQDADVRFPRRWDIEYTATYTREGSGREIVQLMIHKAHVTVVGKNKEVTLAITDQTMCRKLPPGIEDYILDTI